MKYNVIITTCPTAGAAEELARGLLERKLAACVQVLPIESYYTWKGKVENEDELLLLIKAKASSYAKIERFIKEHHTYEVPEIIQVPITKGLPAYLQWMEKTGT